MSTLLNQLKARRKALGLRQQDMEMRVGMPRQQYQRLESRGNPRLDTLELVAKGLNSELMLIPRDKLAAVRAALEGRYMSPTAERLEVADPPALSDDPWGDSLGEVE